MSEAALIKDPSSVGSIAALGAVGLTTTYFYYRIGKLEEELAQIKTHLTTLIQIVDPQNKLKMDQVVAAIRTLDGRVAKAQREIQTIQNLTESEHEPERDNTPNYQRLTRPSRPPPRYTSDQPRESVHRRTAPRVVSSDSENDYDSSHSESEDVSDDLEEAIAAMQ